MSLWQFGLVVLLLHIPLLRVYLIGIFADLREDKETVAYADGLIQASMLAKTPETFEEWALIIWNGITGLAVIAFIILLIATMLS